MEGGFGAVIMCAGLECTHVFKPFFNLFYVVAIVVAVVVILNLMLFNVIIMQ
jgi:hypothetical protein